MSDELEQEPVVEVKTKGKGKAAKPKEEKEVKSSSDILSSFLTQNKDHHYNFEEAIDYKVSSGSLQLDYYLEGGLNPGLHRFTGINEGGKTSAALSFMKSFLTAPATKRKGVYIKAEGRLGEDMRERSGVHFVFTAEEWVDGTCFVFESNIYETVVDFMRQLVSKNDEKNLFFFILDSVDGLISKNDLEKGFEDSNKVAGGAVIAANFMKRMSIGLAKRGHLAIFISQVRADIKLDPYSKAPIRQTTATGGNALLHFANWILEFEPRFRDDLILKNPEEKKIDIIKNPVIGHFAKATVKKSPNEKTNLTIPYPIKYGRKNGTSIWVEKEVADMLFLWEFLTRKTSWISPTEEFNELLVENGWPEFSKIQGMEALFSFLEGQPNLVAFLSNYFKKAMANEI